MFYVKYIHILWRNELKFNSIIIELINQEADTFIKGEHLFITPHKNVYEHLKVYDNIIFDNTKKNLLNKYNKYCKWMILHSIDSMFTLFTAKNNALNKVIFRYWGGNISGFCYKKKHYIINFIKYFANICYRKQIKKYAAIGIANIVDEIDIRRTFKEIPLYKVPYDSLNSYDIIDKVRNKKIENDSNVINVMIGHRGTYEGNHIKILEILKKFKGKNIKIFLPLSYGDSSYIMNLKNYLVEYNAIDVNIITNFMSFEEYVEFINKIDIGIFDGINSYALGNILIFLSLNKKLFLNKDGILRQAFDFEKIPYCLIDDIDTMTYDVFSSLHEYNYNQDSDLLPLTKNDIIKYWKILLDAFN